MKDNTTRNLHQLHLIYGILICIINLLSAIYIYPVDDEMYYWLWSKKLDWGYFDHPPLVAFAIYLNSWIDLQGLDIRGSIVILFLLTLFLWKNILKPKTAKEIHLFYILFLSCTAFQIFGFISTPDALLLCTSSLFLYFFNMYLRANSKYAFIGLAVSMALVMYSKYFGVLLISLAFIPNLSFLGKKWTFYASIILALLLYLPHIFWQIDHQWISIEYHLVERARQNSFDFMKAWNYLGGLILLGSLVFFTIPVGFLKNIFQEKLYRSLLCIAVGSFLLFFILSFFIHTQAHWNLIIYLSLFAISYQYIRQKSIGNWRIFLAILSIAAILLARILVMSNTIETPMAKLKYFIDEVDKNTLYTPALERYQQTSAYTYYKGIRAYCYRVYNHRESQFDIWKDEESMQGKKLSFYGLEKLGEDSLLDNYSKIQYRSDVEKFRSFPRVKFENIKTKIKEDSILISFKTENRYKQTINCKKNSQEVILIGFGTKGFPEFVYKLTEKDSIPSNYYPFQFSIPQDKVPSNLKKFALGMRPKGVSGKKQSDYFEIQNN